MKLTPSQRCYDIIKKWEGLKLEAYLCPANIPTIGYGSTFYADGKPVKLGDKITKQQAEELLPKIVEKYAITVNNHTKVNATQSQFDAMVSLCYNIGIGNFIKSTLLGLFNKKANNIQVANEFLSWNKKRNPVTKVLEVCDGLTNRRTDERDLFLS